MGSLAVERPETKAPLSTVRTQKLSSPQYAGVGTGFPTPEDSCHENQ